MYVLTLTIVHTLVSFVAIGAGMAVVAELLKGDPRGGGLAKLFLGTALFTSASGFAFPFTQFLPSHGTGIVALLVLLPTLLARYHFHLRGTWRLVHAGGLVASLYFLFFVLVAQIFSKIPALREAAPTLAEPPFTITQGILLVVFIGLGIAVTRKLRGRASFA